jgi:capsular polysaccharide biosynthesis protein
MTRTRRKPPGAGHAVRTAENEAGGRRSHHARTADPCFVRELKNRQDVTEALERSGFEVVRTTKSSISIADPDGGETSD